ncbi:MAG: TerB family tellurite resistance protein [Nitrospinae bacterium]|nr:TerB family tellurite resistance protein [Nitrospinota bacterium]
MSKFKKLTFLKALTAVAWADGEISGAELEVLKSFYLKFGLGREELRELDPYLEAPIPKPDQEKIFRQLIAELNSPQEKTEILRALESLAGADGGISGEEKELLSLFSRWLEGGSFAGRSLGKLRNLLSRTILKPAREVNPELEKYFKNRILKRVELKGAAGGSKIKPDSEGLYRACLLGTLLASVAYADERFGDTERQSLQRVLQESFSFGPGEMSVLSEAVEEQARKGFDFHEVATEVNRLFSYNDRLKLTDCFFSVAGADNGLSFAESEEVRRVTKALRIPHKVYIESKMNTLNKLRSGER